ncbi:hypothetical protein KM043_018407 [Ampulex compressa]|nr:hypothetical protein KM043_018407 [Ampulex compressa]
MAQRMDMRQMLRILEICGNFTNTWPPSPEASSRELLFRNAFWTFTVVCFLGVLVPLILCVYFDRDDLMVTMKMLAELTVATDASCNMVLCRIMKYRLQSLVTRMKIFLNTSNSNERGVLQKYIDRYWTFYSYTAITFVLCGIMFCCGPLFLPMDFPIDAWYPFSIDSLFVWSLIYVVQIFVVQQMVFCLTVDFLIATLFWYPAARLEMIMIDLEHATTKRQLRNCVKDHQEVTQFVDDTAGAIQYMIFKTNITMCLSVIAAGVALISKQPLTILSQFITITVASLQRLYTHAWPANDLKEVSQQVALSAYSALWVDKSREMGSTIQIIIQRSQKPLIIPMILLPHLSLEYYANYIKAIMSYYMTVRAVIAD